MYGVHRVYCPCTVFTAHHVHVRSSPYTTFMYDSWRTPHPCTMFAVHDITAQTSLHTPSLYGVCRTLHPCTVFAVHHVHVRCLPCTTFVYCLRRTPHSRTIFRATTPLYGLCHTGRACGGRPGRGAGGGSGRRHEPDGSQPGHDRGVLLHPVHHHRAFRQFGDCEDETQVSQSDSNPMYVCSMVVFSLVRLARVKTYFVMHPTQSSCYDLDIYMTHRTDQIPHFLPRNVSMSCANYCTL